ncbi:MAG: nucleotidyltransferase [Tepidisphaerales bacterium]
MSNADDGLPPSGPALQQAFEALVSILNERGVRYAIIGGLATLQHTRVRTTDDVDALLTVPQTAMPSLFESLRDRGFTVDLARNIRELRDQGLTTLRFRDVMVDLMRPLIPAYAHVLDRAVTIQVLGKVVSLASVEGLIVMKLIAMRPQDQSDIRDLLAAYAGSLDLQFIRIEMESFTESGDPRRVWFEENVRRTTLPDQC